MSIQNRLPQEWLAENASRKYPFADRATLKNRAGIEIPEALFLDAAFFIVGGVQGTYLSHVEITFDTATLTLGDGQAAAKATGSFPILTPPDVITFEDAFGRPAGFLVAGDDLASMRGWGLGKHDFTQAATEFAAAVSMPVPETGLRGILLDDGTILTGDVYLVGEDGVVLRTDNPDVDPQREGIGADYSVIRVDVVGDPLFRRRLCEPADLFAAPRFIKSVRVLHDDGEFTCLPDAYGDIKITVNNDLAFDTVLRLRSSADGIVLEAVGDTNLRT